MATDWKPGDVVLLRGVISQVPEGSPVMLVSLLGPGGAMIQFVTPKEGDHIERVA